MNPNHLLPDRFFYRSSFPFYNQQPLVFLLYKTDWLDVWNKRWSNIWNCWLKKDQISYKKKLKENDDDVKKKEKHLLKCKKKNAMLNDKHVLKFFFFF